MLFAETIVLAKLPLGNLCNSAQAGACGTVVFEKYILFAFN
jgi:hypothetical protein